MKIAVIFNIDRPDTMGIYMQRAFTSLGIQCDHFESRESERIPGGYDLYFRIDDDWYGQDLPDRLKPRALWANDVHMSASMKNLRKMAPRYDFIFTPSTIGEREFRKRGLNAYWVSAGCDPEVHKNLLLPKKFDVGFVGTEGGIPRKFYLQELRERFPRSFIGQASHTQMSEIYSQSKVGFNLAVRDECFQMRSYEILSCGAMLLMHRMADESTKRLGYENGIHYVEFMTASQMFDSIKFYLKHDEEREKIARAGHEFTVSNHRYVDRVREMLRIMQPLFSDQQFLAR